MYKKITYLTYLDGHLTPLGEGEVLHQVGVLVHGEDAERHGLEWHREELDDVLLALLGEFSLVLLLAQTTTTLQDGVDVLTLLGVASQRKVQEGHLQIQQVLELNLTRIVEDLVDVLLEHLVDVHLLVEGLHVVVEREISQPVHQVDEDVLHVDVVLQLRRAHLEQLLQGVEVVLIGEGLDDAIHEVTLRDGILGAHHQLHQLGEDFVLVAVEGDTLQVAEAGHVLPDHHLQVETFPLSLALLFGALHADPQLVHFGKVADDDLDGIIDVASTTLILTA